MSRTSWSDEPRKKRRGHGTACWPRRSSFSTRKACRIRRCGHRAGGGRDARRDLLALHQQDRSFQRHVFSTPCSTAACCRWTNWWKARWTGGKRKIRWRGCASCSSGACTTSRRTNSAGACSTSCSPSASSSKRWGRCASGIRTTCKAGWSASSARCATRSTSSNCPRGWTRAARPSCFTRFSAAFCTTRY